MSCFTNARAQCRAVRNALVYGTMLTLCTFLAPLAQAGSAQGHGRTPDQFNLVACYQLVQREGRMIAWARWEERFPEQKIRTGQFSEGTPVWVVELVQIWISDAYAWQVTDAQVQQWAEELGNARNLPSAKRLSTHQTIAIWMRRISRQCDSKAEAKAQEGLVAHLP
jgi:hypothetical protein